MRALRACVVCCLALGVAAGLAPRPAGAAVSAASGPEADLRAGRAFVLVVADKGDRLKQSEAYGDWQSYLQSFVQRGRGELPVHQVTPERARILLPNWPRGLRNATLFANPQGKGLLHRGRVLEPHVYQLGKAFAERGSLTPEAACFGLEPFQWRPH